METAGLKAVYTLRPPSTIQEAAPGRTLVPITYVCRASTLDEADRIHRLVWNQSVAPFVVVLAPQGVRLYSGFESPSRAGRTRHAPMLVKDDLANAVRALRDLSAASIDSGEVWDKWGAMIRPEHRVEWRLLENLQILERQIVQTGLDDRRLVHALIGKYVYLHYLRERGILSDERLGRWDVSWNRISGRTANPVGFRRICDELENWLNGSIFPLEPRELKAIGEDVLRKVASVFAGEAPDGQLHLDFPAYDFSHIPVETLSVIYEQFLHATPTEAGTSAGEHQAAYYTPVPVANFIIDRMEELHPLQPPMRACDFSCGSGTFLVQCYRKLIEDRLRTLRDGQKLRPTELRELLVSHIFGLDVDPDACRVAEFSLQLTLLDYVDPPDLTNTTFKLPALSGRNIIEANAFDEQNGFVANAKKRGFDWIVGNPPWKDVKGTTTDDAIHKPVLDWMLKHKRDKPTGGNQTAEAFAWRTADFANREALAGLLLPAMTLFKSESKAFRRRFFSSNELAYVANFANLAEVLFAGRSRVPAASIVFRPGQEASASASPHRIPVFSPLVANQEATRPRARGTRTETWTLVIDEGEVRSVAEQESQRGEALTWKLAGWGSHLDRAILRRTERLPELRELTKQAGLTMSEGLQLRRKTPKTSERLEHHPELAERPKLVTKQLSRIERLFVFPASAIQLVDNDETYVREGRFELPESVCRPPHVLVSAARNWAVFSDKYLVVPPRQIGIAGSRDQMSLLKALTLYLNSDFVLYHQFFFSPQFGVQRAISTLKTIRRLPVPQILMPNQGLNDWVRLHDELAAHDSHRSGGSDRDDSTKEKAALLKELNSLVYDALGLQRAETARVKDFVNVLFGLRDGKTEERAVAPPRESQLRAYASTLKRELDAFVGNGKRGAHAVEVWPGDRDGIIQILLADREAGVTVHAASEGASVQRQATELRNRLTARFAQWRYFNRSLRIFAEDRAYLFKPMQRFHWLESQAVLDASEVIGMVLDGARGRR